MITSGQREDIKCWINRNQRNEELSYLSADIKNGSSINELIVKLLGSISLLSGCHVFNRVGSDTMGLKSSQGIFAQFGNAMWMASGDVTCRDGG